MFRPASPTLAAGRLPQMTDNSSRLAPEGTSKRRKKKIKESHEFINEV
jgi:hypothetical protein